MNEPDYITAAEIARRYGLSRQLISAYTRGKKGPAGFPQPTPWVAGANCYDWDAVRTWFRENTTHTLRTDCEY